MKTKIFFLGIIICSLTSLYAQDDIRRVAILETVDKENKINYGMELMLRSNISSAITNTAGYEGYDRVDLASIKGEQDFQRTGMVSDADIKQIGVMTGAQYILVAEAAMADNTHMIVVAKIIDVETARLISVANELIGMGAVEMQKGSKNLAAALLSPITTQPGTLTPNNTKAYRPTVSHSAPTSLSSNVITKEKNEYIIDGKWYSRKEFLQFIKANTDCHKAYLEYQRAHKMEIAGWVLGCAGLCATTFGIGYSAERGEYPDYATVAGCVIPGVAAVAASVPLLAVSYHKYNNLHTIYNTYCTDSRTAQASLSLQASKNGLGLALHF